MKERPILFSTPMVRAIMAGKKTQTRRVIKPQPEYAQSDGRLLRLEHVSTELQIVAKTRLSRHCPYGEPRDRLWVRETWAVRKLQAGYWVEYKADASNAHINNPALLVNAEQLATTNTWRPSIFMPRWASRLVLEVVSARVERIQDISEDDASAEGIDYYSRAPMAARERFPILWDSINATHGYGWDKNPWVWVIGFEVIPW